jgi:hypothetical protein
MKVARLRALAAAEKPSAAIDLRDAPTRDAPATVIPAP